MTAFSAEWLQLREGADQAARNSEIANAVSARFALRDAISVVDLGCGTGANLRATASLLPNRQLWRLIDSDPALLDAARIDLIRWADTALREGDELILRKGHADIRVSFSQLDLATDIERAFDGAPALITASALFDLVSETFIKTIARLCTERNAAFYTVLTYNGVQRWSPHRPADNQIASAFHRHQLGDKGFGPAAGPMAPSILADQFRLNGYTVLEGESYWVLGRNDRMLLEELQRGYAMAAAETGIVDAKTIEGWIKVQRSGAEVGHTDTFAAPA
ncbi:MAG: class I SAM-dependent methyltransferase [Hyphomicrobium sp.]|jgi:SAM-dependent methyltransferase|nr:class I SAM-dependent methyltransferase [Hyphomicrobium sp.]